MLRASFASLLAVAVLCSTPLAACDLPDPPGAPAPTKAGAPATPTPPPAKPAPTTKWSTIGSGYLNFEGDDFEHGTQMRLYVRDDGLHLQAVKLPVGTIIQAGEQSYTTTDEPKAQELVVPIDDTLATQPWDGLKELVVSLDLGVSFRVTVPGYEPVEATPPPLPVSNGLESRFRALAKGELQWPQGSSPPPAAAAWLHNKSFAALGKADTAADVRFIATTESTPNGKTKRCTGYTGAPDFTATSHDVTVSIVDRITKEVVAKKSFSGRTGCPRMVASGPKLAPSHSEGPSVKTMKAWVTGQLPKLARAAAKSDG